MKARPILFSSPMVRALLDGSKTQTRRVVKPQPDLALAYIPRSVTGFDLIGTEIRTGRQEWGARAGSEPINVFSAGAGCVTDTVRCPYGAPGDLLWVRETCRAEELSRPQTGRAATVKERELLGRTRVQVLDELDGADGVRFAADGEWRKIENSAAAGEMWLALFYYRGRGKSRIGNQVPGIHMPRWASRLTLEITDVRVERLQDISEADVLAEGIDPFDSQLVSCGAEFRGGRCVSAHEVRTRVPAYARLWNHINGPGSWDANPWCWAVSFRVHRANVDRVLAQLGAAA